MRIILKLSKSFRSEAVATTVLFIRWKMLRTQQARGMKNFNVNFKVAVAPPTFQRELLLTSQNDWRVSDKGWAGRDGAECQGSSPPLSHLGRMWVTAKVSWGTCHSSHSLEKSLRRTAQLSKCQ